MDLSNHRNAGSQIFVARLANKPIIIFSLIVIGFISLAEISESIVGGTRTYNNLRNSNSKYQYSNNHVGHNSTYNYNNHGDGINDSNNGVANGINDSSGESNVGGSDMPSSAISATSTTNHTNDINRSFFVYMLTIMFFVMLLMFIRRVLMYYCILRRTLANRTLSTTNGNATHNRSNDILQRISSNLFFPMSLSFNNNMNNNSNIGGNRQQIEMALNRLRANPNMQGFLGGVSNNEDRLAMQRFLSNIIAEGDPENMVDNAGASDSQINRLPLHTYHDTTINNHVTRDIDNDNIDNSNSNSNSNSDSNNNNSCAVCLCPFEEGELIRTTPCMHMFHQKCVDQWLQQRSICPVCKYSIIT